MASLFSVTSVLVRLSRASGSAAGLLLALSGVWAAGPAQEWKDAKGATFRGEPAEVVGPMALFRTGAVTSKFLPMRALSPEDCVRFHQALADRPPRAGKWSEATGRATAEFIGRLQRVENRQLRPVDLTTLPEPELLIVLFSSRRREGDNSWRILDNLAPFISRVQRVYPGRVASIVLSTREANYDPRNLPAARGWLAVEPGKLAGLKLLSRFTPGEGMVMLLMTREGVPLFGAPANDIVEVMRFVDGASNFLWELNPVNPRTARDRAHYLRAVRPLEFATGQTGPLLLADPFKVEGLRQHGVGRIDATLEVAADGAVAGVALLPSSQIPPPLVAAVTQAMQRNALFVPAIAQGQAVAGTHAYSLVVGPLDPKLAADAAWVNGDARVDVPIKSWLVLKPVHVPEQVFSTIDRIGEDGTVMLSAVTAGKAGQVSTASQMNSFHSDWFTGAGAGSVRPILGEKQEIDGEKLSWKRVTPNHGLVDFIGNSGNLDYCIGYAWTEVEVPEATDGWLGIGSDDGLKVWLNGELVNDKWIARTSRLDDEVVPLRLKQGRNQFLIKIQNVKGLWSFTCRLRVRGK